MAKFVYSPGRPNTPPPSPEHKIYSCGNFWAFEPGRFKGAGSANSQNLQMYHRSDGEPIIAESVIRSFPMFTLSEIVGNARFRACLL